MELCSCRRRRHPIRSPSGGVRLSAVLPPRSTGRAALAFSPTLRTWRFPWQERKPLYEDTEALAALAALRADLVSKGWERMRRASGSEWYELRFRRNGSDDPGSSDRRAPARRSRRATGPRTVRRSPNDSRRAEGFLVGPFEERSRSSRCDPRRPIVGDKERPSPFPTKAATRLPLERGRNSQACRPSSSGRDFLTVRSHRGTSSKDPISDLGGVSRRAPPCCPHLHAVGLDIGKHGCDLRLADPDRRPSHSSD